MKTLNDKELKAFIINFINRKEKESENKDYIEYSYYELKVKANLSEKQIDEVLRVSRDYFENHNYKVYFTEARYEYKGKFQNVPTNKLMIAFKEMNA